MKALVTGGAGFIGSHIVAGLLREKHKVVILDDLSAGSMERVPTRETTFIKGSITDKEALEKATKGIDVIFHEAAQVSVAYSMTHPKETWETNIRGTKLVLNAAAKAGVRRVVFASSAAVYGNALPPLHEEKDLKPISPYGDSKRMGELLMQEYSEKEGLETVSLRYFNVYGPGQNPRSEYSGVISKFIVRMTQGERPVIFGNGTQTRDFIFVGDVAKANLLAALAKKAKGEAYNIATGRAISINELAGTLNKVLGSQLEPVFEPEKPGDIKYSFADASLAKKKIGFEARTTLEQGLKDTTEWFLSTARKG
jgi:nucleoside-diphosphate-sugar epimerase